MKKYGVKFREIYNRQTKKLRKVYSPVIYKINGKEMFVSESGEILEFYDKEDALKEAKETYEKFKDEWVGVSYENRTRNNF